MTPDTPGCNASNDCSECKEGTLEYSEPLFTFSCIMPTMYSRFEGIHKSPTRWAVARSSGVGMLRARCCCYSNLEGRQVDKKWFLQNSLVLSFRKDRVYRQVSGAAISKVATYPHRQPWRHTRRHASNPTTAKLGNACDSPFAARAPSEFPQQICPRRAENSTIPLRQFYTNEQPSRCLPKFPISSSSSRSAGARMLSVRSHHTIYTKAIAVAARGG